MKSKSILLTILSSLILSPTLLAEQQQIDATIEVTEESYSDIYKAVWLDPNKGTIHKLTERSEKPPVKGAMIWIEPNDPEFSVSPNMKDVNIYHIGEGEAVFKSANDHADIEGMKRVKKSLLKSGKKPVFIIKTAMGKSAIMIEHSSEDHFKFRWRKLASE